MVISPVEKLRRFLKLELNRNCDNRAVVGGMGKFLPNWQKESATAGIAPELNEKVTAFLTSYLDKDPDERKKLGSHHVRPGQHGQPEDLRGAGLCAGEDDSRPGGIQACRQRLQSQMPLYLAARTDAGTERITRRGQTAEADGRCPKRENARTRAEFARKKGSRTEDPEEIIV